MQYMVLLFVKKTTDDWKNQNAIEKGEGKCVKKQSTEMRMVAGTLRDAIWGG